MTSPAHPSGDDGTLFVAPDERKVHLSLAKFARQLQGIERTRLFPDASGSAQLAQDPAMIANPARTTSAPLPGDLLLVGKKS
jgi:hypothetical protein